MQTLTSVNAVSIPKKAHFSRQEIASTVIVILLAIGFRLFLICYNSPVTDSEEGTFGIEALHIAYKGSWPIWMYGQNYMGVAESYVGAVMFHLFGVSVFSLRLGMLLFFSVFLVLVYLLGRSLYGHMAALVSLIFLVGATDITIVPQLKAVGGVEEMLVSGTLCMLLATWLVMSTTRSEPPRRWRRMLAYAGWGLAAGFGLWSHMLVAPFVLCSALLLFIFCRREFLGFMGLCLLIGLVIGAWPLIMYNLHAPLDQTTPMVLLQVYNYKPSAHVTLLQKLLNTFDYTLPLETGAPHLDASVGHLPLRMDMFQGLWSTIYLSLLLISTFSACKGVRSYLVSRREGTLDASSKYQFALEVARLMLILSAILTIASFAISSNAALRPWSFRYLSGLMITNVVVLAPLVRPLTNYRQVRGRILTYAGGVLSLVLIAGSIVGTVMGLSTLPEGNAQIEQQAVLITGLKNLGVKNFYSGYWVCDGIIFQSGEDLTCGIIGSSLKPQLTRYRPYGEQVARDPNAAYVFPDDSPSKAMNQLAQDKRYQRVVIGRYIVFYVNNSSTK